MHPEEHLVTRSGAENDSPKRVKSFNILQLPEESSLVEDADEEIFYIYTMLQSSPSPQDAGNLRGLGFLDSKKDVIELRFDLVPPSIQVPPDFLSKKQTRGKQKGTAKKVPSKPPVEVQLIQDKTALRSRKGDTGSVIWKASVDFARYVLQEDAFPSGKGLFDKSRLNDAHVVELGAGTGLLSLIFSSFVRRYTVTDHPNLIHLISKNVKNNFPGWPNLSPGSPGQNISVEGLDWIQVHSGSNASESQHQKIFAGIKDAGDPSSAIDLILVVDCIYHPSLIPPLLSTIHRLATAGVTEVLVVSELRSDEVLREFLEGWLSLPGWSVRHVGGDPLQDVHYVLWVGRKSLEP